MVHISQYIRYERFYVHPVICTEDKVAKVDYSFRTTTVRHFEESLKYYAKVFTLHRFTVCQLCFLTCYSSSKSRRVHGIGFKFASSL
jgi:uncharacterized protein YvpB